MPSPINRVSTPSTSTPSLTVAARTWAEGFNFSSQSAVNPIDVPRKQAASTGPVQLFGVSSSGRDLKALNVPTAPEPTTGPDPRAVIQSLLGADRPVEVKTTQTSPAGTRFDLAWSPPTGGVISAKLNVPSDGSSAGIEGVQLPSAIGSVETGLAGRVTEVTGTPVKGLSYASRGSDWLVAHQPAAGGPITLSKVKVALGGATASVGPTAIGTSGAQLDQARWLALGLARVHAESMVADPNITDAARLEVALRTRWAQAAELEQVAPADSAVGFDPAKDRVQFMLPRVWGDNAVLVTFEKDGGVRVEDFN
ncbi:MAG: hypothetical protein JNK82_11755 [Myxococcaceae bacterium]|nr:hypothetical protein [Myxococcaceae bacterium]